MRVDWDQHMVEMAVGEWSSFGLTQWEGVSGGTALAVMQEGRRWHDQLAAQAARQFPGSRFEWPLSGNLPAGRWTLQLNGRIDQLLALPDAWCLREIKAVGRSLPADPDELRLHYPAYFNQLAAYFYLLPLIAPGEFPFAGQPTSNTAAGTLLSSFSCAAELLFVSRQDGIVQALSLDQTEAARLVREQSARLEHFLEVRRDGRVRMRAARPFPPFSQFRQGQEELRLALRHPPLKRAVTLLQAPTGFGKTGILLEYALERLCSGNCERILYLTGKSTGQIPVARQVTLMCPPSTGIRVLQLRNRQEHGPEERGSEPIGQHPEERVLSIWESTGLDPARFFVEGPPQLADIVAAARSCAIAPHRLSRALLPYADLWLADYNYLFHTPSAAVFKDVPDFDPARSLLIIDEAHNLPYRAAEAWNQQLSTEILHDLLTEMRFAGCPRDARHNLEALLEWLENLAPTPQLDLSETYVLNALLDNVIRHYPRFEEEPDLFTDAARERLRILPGLRASLQLSDLQHLLWSPSPGLLRFDGLDASRIISNQLQQFPEVILCSATLAPQDLFAAQCGVEPSAYLQLEGTAPCRKDACNVALDLRADTRLRARNRTLPLTARTILQLAAASDGPLAAFFPSYRYAEDCCQICRQMDPLFHGVLQARSLPLAQQAAFLEEHSRYREVLFLILGSGSSEGIDVLGGRVKTAIVVGPALPEVNAVQDARMQALAHLPRPEAFRRVYLVPAMRKINQALGRLVRSPGHRARVLLHDRRFQESTLQSLLDPIYLPQSLIRSDSQLLDWALQ